MTTYRIDVCIIYPKHWCSISRQQETLYKILKGSKIPIDFSEKNITKKVHLTLHPNNIECNTNFVCCKVQQLRHLQVRVWFRTLWYLDYQPFLDLLPAPKVIKIWQSMIIDLIQISISYGDMKNFPTSIMICRCFIQNIHKCTLYFIM